MAAGQKRLGVAQAVRLWSPDLVDDRTLVLLEYVGAAEGAAADELGAPEPL